MISHTHTHTTGLAPSLPSISVSHMFEPTTNIPLTRNVSAHFPSVLVRHASKKKIQSSEVDWFHDPPIHSSIDVSVSLSTTVEDTASMGI
jgi:hypothetical protein